MCTTGAKCAEKEKQRSLSVWDLDQTVCLYDKSYLSPLTDAVAIIPTLNDAWEGNNKQMRADSLLTVYVCGF